MSTKIKTQAPKTEAEKTLEVIDNYLQENESWTRSLPWLLHCFCRRKSADDISFQSGTLEFTVWIIEGMIKTFMDPKASKIFCKVSGFQAEDLAETLMALRTLFTELSEDSVALARIERIEPGYFGSFSDRTEKEMHDMRIRYERANDLDNTKKRLITYHAGRFDRS